MSYLPDINFNRVGRVTLPEALDQPEHTTEPIQVLRDAFEKYIVQSPVESGSIGLQVIFTTTGEYHEAQTLFLMKRQYRWPRPVSEQLQIGTIEKYIKTRDIANGESFDNNQINTMVEYLQRGSTKILEIVLCEVYNDNQMSRDINQRSIQLSNRETYYPFTIPIKVLYRSRDINNRVYNSPSIVREKIISREQLRQAQILGITLPQFQRLLSENPEQIRREVRVALAIRRRSVQNQESAQQLGLTPSQYRRIQQGLLGRVRQNRTRREQERQRERALRREQERLAREQERQERLQRRIEQGTDTLQSSRASARELGLTLAQYRNIRQGVVTTAQRNRGRRERMAQLTDPEAQQRLLENWPVEITQQVHDPNNESENPNPLQYINDQILLAKPLTSYVWPGMCQICFTDDREGLCRVNCEAGHIFHCECVNSWRNTRKTNTYYEHDWHNDCPVCHEEIESMVMVTPAVAEKLPSSFGKSSKQSMERLLKVVESEIRYLNSI
uniref:RING-type domain-containing protein n=1 Tax=viral metagenome TaxID=1070528 RepID=A0A6C0AYT7_9ZZZZ